MNKTEERDEQQPEKVETPKPSQKPPTAKKTSAVGKPAAKKLPVTKTATKAGPPHLKGGWPNKRTFPIVTLQDALKVAQAIRLKNGGNPMTTALVATACDTTAKGDKFFYLTSAAQNYNLTVGSRNSSQIELTTLGRAIVYATSPIDEQEKKIEAFFTVEKFKLVYDNYNGSNNLPEKQYLSNALENQFQLPPDEHDEFTEVFKANCIYLGIDDGLKTRRSRTENGDTNVIDVRSMGKPKGDFERTAFVIMPFSEKGKQERPKGFFDEVLKSVITPAANTAGFAVETARQEDSDIIHHTIINRLLHDDLVIADLTDHNPNVLFELGIRLAKKS